ncbi:AAA family ATPase [Legionella septentrionalis]|uniref:AAA family ATPase n=1 Tax=Legionella septentrionalis TaxID=2498109 RepID=UPI000F8C3BB4|nr:AAA family ATPase [Legionella septentrionalis]RUR12430.1 AAA family ATPase [Legionella septentrionalis]
MSTEPSLISVNLIDFLAMKLRPREYLLSPWLPKSGLCMVYAWRGVGKTFFALEVAMAVAHGVPFLCFDVPKPANVLYLDGEMPANTMQERLAIIAKRMKISNEKANLNLITPDLQDRNMPDLGNRNQQYLLDKYTDKADLIIVDNISTLSSTGKENEAESWIPIQQWCLKLRKQGKSVLFIHHAGKNGNERGTSKREDILDTVIKLKHPSDYSPTEGARFEIHFEKARGIMGDDVHPLICQFNENTWEYSRKVNDVIEKAIELFNKGHRQNEIALQLEKTPGYISKIITRAKKEGKITI